MSRSAQLLILDLQPETPLGALADAAGLGFDHAVRVEEARVLLERGMGRYSALLASPGSVGDWGSLNALLETATLTLPTVLTPAALAPRRTPPGVTRLDSLPTPDGLRSVLRELTAYREAPAAPSGALHLDTERREVRVAGQVVPLTAKEYLLLELLAEHRGRLFRRDEILERIWGLDFIGDDRIVDSYVKRLRKKVGEEAVETVRGLGYRCPEGSGRAAANPQLTPHFQHLPLEARLMTLLAERVLRVSQPAEIVFEVHSLLSEAYAVASVSLLAWSARGAGEVLAHAGAARAERLDQGGHALAEGPLYQGAQPGRAALALIPLSAPDAEPWAALAFGASERLPSWDEATCSALEVVSALVSPALRLNWEISRRERAEAQVRSLNGELETRIEARTRDLAHAMNQSEALHALSQRLEHTRTVAEVQAAGLSDLARMGGARAGVLWERRSEGFVALSGHAADGASWPVLGLLEPRGLCLHASAEHLVELVGTAQAGADLPLLSAAARSFGLALERGLHAAHLELTALTDEFSSLPNRRAFLADLTAEVAFSTRHGSPLGLSLFEIVNIRELNTARGHAGGSALIRALAEALQATLRLEDRAYRISGATFAALLPGRVESGTQAPAPAVAERLNSFVERFMARASGQGPGRVLVSAVHLSRPADGASVAELLRLGLDRLAAAARGLQAPPPPDSRERYASDD